MGIYLCKNFFKEIKFRKNKSQRKEESININNAIKEETNENNKKEDIKDKIFSLKLKFTKKINLKRERINKIAMSPSGIIILTTNKGTIYVYDSNFNLKAKKESNTNNIYIKDDSIFITYSGTLIKIWLIENKTEITLKELEIINNVSDVKNASILNNDDIIGIAKNTNGKYSALFIYEKTKNFFYQKKNNLSFKKEIQSFLIINKNKFLIISIKAKIYIYNYRSLTLKKIIDFGLEVCNIKLIYINDNTFGSIFFNESMCAPEYFELYDINNLKKIQEKTFIEDIHDEDEVVYFSSKRILVNIEWYYIYYHKIDKDVNKRDKIMYKFSFYYHRLLKLKLLKLNENEICVYGLEENNINILEFE